MAVEPLFVSTMDTLKSSVRMTSAANPDALRALDDAVLKVRMGFYDRLPSSVIDAIRATPYSDAPTTTQGIQRLRASQAEITWVRLFLYRTLPVLFMGASSQARDEWNQLEIVRDMGSSNIQKEIERLQAEVEDYLGDMLSGQPTESSINVSLIGPARTPPRPGESIFGYRPRYGYRSME